ncbi:MAG TPA: two-component regulator propeller domain-containing protein, partial [Cyclobacteriaceae bacterium]|nr:two-component regulator propeller domain-containing protein [Cyclobacteriaceae bacterium]
MTRACLIAACLLLTGIASAQPGELRKKRIIFDQLLENQSLSQSSINCVLQDHDGFLWIGTFSGLIRYDGYKTTVFHSENLPGKIQSNKIITLYEDRDGYLWIGTHMGGLFRYDKHRNEFEHFSYKKDDPRSLSNNNVWAIEEDQHGNLWIGTETGLNILRKGKTGFDRISKVNTPSLSYDFITDIHLSTANEVWVSTEEGLNKLVVTGSPGNEHYAFENFTYEEDASNKFLHNYIYQIEELTVNGKPTIWLSTKKGLKGLQNNKLTNFLVPGKSLSYSFFRSVLAVDDAKPFLIAGSEMGLSIFDPETQRFESVPNDDYREMNMSHRTITALYIDQGGVLWVGTKKGLNKFDSYSKDFEAFHTTLFDKSKNIITGVQNSSMGGYWISTIGGGLFKFDGKSSFTHYKIVSREENDFTEFIQTLYSDNRGNIWVGTAGAGVYHFNEKDVNKNGTIHTFDHYFTKSVSSLSDDYVMSLAGDRDGNILVGMWSGGLNKITPAKKVIDFNEPSLKRTPVVVLHPDHTGTIWVGTRGKGFYRIRENSGKPVLKHYFKDETNDSLKSINNNFINAIYEDHAGTLWIGTDGGLNSFDRRTEEFSHYPLEGGPSNDVIVSILEDDQGKLWLAHWNGLTVIDPADARWMRNYDNNDRIMGGFFYNNVCVKSREGHLLFAGSEGFNRIDTKRIVQKPEVYPLAITQFELFGKPVTYGEEIDGRVILTSPLRNKTQVKLKHFENSIAFEFASLDYAAPEKIRYAYMLEGFNKEWSYTTSDRRYANYTNLNYGKYTFKVKATSTDGVWSDGYSEVKITILPPWWKTNWALLLYIVVAFLVLYGFRKLVLLRANLIHDIKLERLQRENMEKLNKAKLQFFTNISHEFRTPLTLILGPAQSLLDSSSLGKVFRNNALNISTNAQRLLRLVNQLLDFRKAESGNLKLQVSEGNIVRFVKEIKLSFDLLAEQMNIRFTMESSSPIIKLWFDRDQFEKIMFNLLSNAFKHTPAEHSISIQVQEAAEEVVITVEDTGKGIKSEHFDKIFQTFFSYDDDKHHTGTGIGLALTKSLIDMHHGKIDLQSREGEFTRFIIHLKKGTAHFHESEIQHFSDDIETMDRYPSLTGLDLAPVETAQADDQGSAVKSEQKLLIVEDNEGVRSYIKSIFQSEYEIIEAANGEDGLSMAVDQSPDLVISDIMMPLMDGITLCKKLKSDVRTSHIPVILLTARTALIFKVEGLETGADDYVTKPFNPKLLELKVRNFIRIREAMRNHFSGKDVLTIEPRKVTLTSADEVFVSKMVESIEKNMSNADYSVEELGLDVGMSKMQLYRKMKALTSQSANEFIRTMRLKRAAQLLEQKQLTVAE